MTQKPPVTIEDVKAVSPALAHYTETAIINDMWKRPQLSPRDRSLVTVAALVASERTIGYAHYFNLALTTGVSPAELSELLVQVAFYAGWSAPFSAVPVLMGIFTDRGVSSDQLPAAKLDASTPRQVLPIDERRMAGLEAALGSFVPDLVEATIDLVDLDLWARPGLSPRDRSLVTFAALVATGRVDAFPPYLGKAVALGVKREEVVETITHLAFYLGWPSSLTAARAAKSYFEQ